MLYKKIKHLVLILGLLSLTMCRDLQKYDWQGLGHDWECFQPYIRIFNNRQFFTKEQVEKNKAPEGFIEIDGRKTFFSIGGGSFGEHTVYLFHFSFEDGLYDGDAFLKANVEYEFGYENMFWTVTYDSEFALENQILRFSKTECFTATLND